MELNEKLKAHGLDKTEYLDYQETKLGWASRFWEEHLAVETTLKEVISKGEASKPRKPKLPLSSAKLTLGKIFDTKKSLSGDWSEVIRQYLTALKEESEFREADTVYITYHGSMPSECADEVDQWGLNYSKLPNSWEDINLVIIPGLLELWWLTVDFGSPELYLENSLTMAKDKEEKFLNFSVTFDGEEEDKTNVNLKEVTNFDQQNFYLHEHGEAELGLGLTHAEITAAVQEWIFRALGKKLKVFNLRDKPIQ